MIPDSARYGLGDLNIVRVVHALILGQKYQAFGAALEGSVLTVPDIPWETPIVSVKPERGCQHWEYGIAERRSARRRPITMLEVS
jgi:hypothetical protein